MSTIPELGPRDFVERWPDFPESGVTLLDVREPHELAISSIPGCVHIPMGQIPGRLNELDKQSTIVVICRSGARSLRVAEFMAASGFESVYNLKGGINAWSTEVDPTLMQY